MDDRYINTFLSNKSIAIQIDIKNMLELSLSNNFNNDIITEFLLSKKKLKFSYKVIGSFRRNSKYLEVILIGRTIISHTLYYNDFIKYYRNEILNRLIE